jgi:hypothetical protein
MYRFERWKGPINRARTPGEVVQVMQEYANTWLPSDLGKLPPCCQILKVGSVEELSSLAVMITREEIAYVAPDMDSEARMKNLAMTFAAAAYRIAELHAPIPRPQAR